MHSIHQGGCFHLTISIVKAANSRPQHAHSTVSALFIWKSPITVCSRCCLLCNRTFAAYCATPATVNPNPSRQGCKNRRAHDEQALRRQQGKSSAVLSIL